MADTELIFPRADEVLDFSQRLPCLLCGSELHLMADQAADEYVWADKDSRMTGTDKDLWNLPGADPYARLQVLDRELTVAQAARRCAPTWLYWERAREYSALKVRTELAGSVHVHQAPHDREPARAGVPAPQHCGWPMLLRPSGWHCRQAVKNLSRRT